jgi:phosphatidate cytidylyltransferase
MPKGNGDTVRASADAGPTGAPTRPAAARWRDLRKRVLSAALLAPAALLCIWLGAEAWTALMAAAAAVLAWEWVKLCGFSTRRLPGLCVPVAVLAAGTLAVEAQWLPSIAVLGVGALALSALSGPSPTRGRGGPAGKWLGFGVLYIGLAAVALIHLRGDAAAGRLNVLFLFVTVWASDIGAYAAGRWLGGPKLAPSVSPNKTWSGAAGGLLSAVAVGAAAAYLMAAAGSPVPTGRVLLVAGGIGVLAQAGDFFESWIKRRFDVKDSSTLIPGHGGLLDRLDGVLAAAPAAAVLGVLLGPGEALWR